MFKEEAQLRAAVRLVGKGDLFWIEAAPGGTGGLPDTFVTPEGFFHGMELKVGEMRGDECRFTVRTAQRITNGNLRKNGARVAYAVAIEGTRKILIFGGDAGGGAVGFGRLQMRDVVREAGEDGARFGLEFSRETVFAGNLAGQEIQWVFYGREAVLVGRAFGILPPG